MDQAGDFWISSGFRGKAHSQTFAKSAEVVKEIMQEIMKDESVQKMIREAVEKQKREAN